MILIDTDILVWYLRGDSNAARLIDGQSSFCLSAVTYMELVQGMRDKRELRALKDSLRIWRAEVIAIDEKTSTLAMLYMDRFFLSHGIRLADALIGAAAVSLGLTLATANEKHYKMLPDLKLSRFSP